MKAKFEKNLPLAHYSLDIIFMQGLFSLIRPTPCRIRSIFYFDRAKTDPSFSKDISLP